MTQHRTHPTNHEIRKLVVLIIWIDDMMVNEDYDVISDLMADTKADIQATSLETLIGLLRSSLPRRGLIKEWFPFRVEVKKEITRRKANSAILMKGLWP